MCDGTLRVWDNQDHFDMESCAQIKRRSYCAHSSVEQLSNNDVSVAYSQGCALHVLQARIIFVLSAYLVTASSVVHSMCEWVVVADVLK